MSYERPSTAQLENRFKYHAPFGDQAGRYEQIRTKILNTAIFCVAQTPVCPEQTRALNALDEAMFLFNAAIARNEQEK